MKKSLFENNSLPYREENGHLVPDVELLEQKEIGKWGLLHFGLVWICIRGQNVVSYALAG